MLSAEKPGRSKVLVKPDLRSVLPKRNEAAGFMPNSKAKASWSDRLDQIHTFAVRGPTPPFCSPLKHPCLRKSPWGNVAIEPPPSTGEPVSKDRGVLTATPKPLALAVGPEARAIDVEPDLDAAGFGFLGKTRRPLGSKCGTAASLDETGAAGTTAVINSVAQRRFVASNDHVREERSGP